jgi:two-component system NtrC family sensor kinase
MAEERRERILIVEHDPITGDLIGRQALGKLGYKIKLVGDAGSAIQAASSFNPDVVIANLDLPGLSGKDLMAALSFSQAKVPVIMTAAQGQEKDVIQAFRLGASDYISMPIREAEVVAAVNRALQSVRARKEREHLARKLERTNTELEIRVQQLTTLFTIGKAILSTRDQRDLFTLITESAAEVSNAGYCWFLVLDESSRQFILRSQQNLPKSLRTYLNKPWDDGLSKLVAGSGETLSLCGEAIDRFMLASLGRAALVAPVKVQDQVIGLLSVMRREEKAFSASDQKMLEAVADYAAISLVNAQLFRALASRSG